MSQKEVIFELIEKNPGLAKRAKTQPLAAIRLNCLECVCGDKKLVAECSIPTCPLYPFRFGKKPTENEETE